MNPVWQEQEEEASAGRAPIRAPLSGVSVLVVEDDALSREGLSLVLEHYGADVQSAGNVADALDQLDHSSPNVDVLVSDIGLPGEDGMDLIRRIRAAEDAAPSRLPAIALSGFSDPTLPGKTRAAGFDRFFTKPVDVSKLVATIKSLAAQRTLL